MGIGGMKCPKCGKGVLERWPAGDETNEDATWVCYRCNNCSYVLKVKHVD